MVAALGPEQGSRARALLVEEVPLYLGGGLNRPVGPDHRAGAQAQDHGHGASCHGEGTTYTPVHPLSRLLDPPLGQDRQEGRRHQDNELLRKQDGTPQQMREQDNERPVPQVHRVRGVAQKTHRPEVRQETQSRHRPGATSSND